MAWEASLATLTTSDWVTAAQFADLKAAAHERAGWVGDQTQHDNVEAMNVAGDAWVTAANINTLRTAVEGILGKFYRDDTFASGLYTAWTKAVLLQHLWDSHGGEDSGVHKTGAAYDWARVPNSTSGAMVAGDWIYHEHVVALYQALDHLRYVTLQVETAGAEADNCRTLAKSEPDNRTSLQAAWTAMLADTPDTTSADAGIQLIAHKMTAAPPYDSWRADTGRLNSRWKFTNAPLAGHFPAGYASGKFGYKITSSHPFKGPFIFSWGLAAVTTWASGTTVLDDSVALVNTWYERTLSDVSPFPTSGTNFFLQSKIKNDDQATTWADTWDGDDYVCDVRWGPAGNVPSYQGRILLKPTTAYGT
ncbi:MAG: hypothetical protein FD189_1117 [Elusimicrobia bacterium]|nr:MAG: hypothetical protein FD189_1117 [Elusimicrobiota bacterium]